ncbi:MAG: hypothetical protein M1818_002635 [Claussenomyces sp. TS43310]|nr:MAG: hypothetical protein M1818_002635 [Claussenomyces sp. TS43310]
MASEAPDFQLFSSLRFDPILSQCPANTVLGGAPSPLYMLSYHRDRMLYAAQHFQWPEAVSRISGADGLRYLQGELETALDLDSTVPMRVRALLSHTGEVTVESNETPSVPLSNLFPARIPPPQPAEVKVSPLTGGALVLGADILDGDPEKRSAWRVKPDPDKTKPSSFTRYKTTCRDMYAGARARADIKLMTEPQEVLIISHDDDGIMEGSLTSVFFWRKGRWVTPPIASGGQAGTTRRWLLERGLCEEEVVGRTSLVDGEECWISNGVRGLIWGRIEL